MSEASTATPAAEKAGSKSDGDSAKKTGASDSSTAPAQQSAREAVGGKTEVHYGYFSNVRTPEYRSGWDSIWGGRETNGARRKTARPARARPRSPVRLTLDFDDLPEAARDALREAAEAALKAGSRLSYARREKAGAVSWSIECEIRR